jgi:hypothetical protein
MVYELHCTVLVNLKVNIYRYKTECISLYWQNKFPILYANFCRLGSWAETGSVPNRWETDPTKKAPVPTLPRVPSRNWGRVVFLELHKYNKFLGYKKNFHYLKLFYTNLPTVYILEFIQMVPNFAYHIFYFPLSFV